MPTLCHSLTEFVVLIKTPHFYEDRRSATFKMSYSFHRFDQKTNEIFLRISALEVKKNKGTLLY